MIIPAPLILPRCPLPFPLSGPHSLNVGGNTSVGIDGDANISLGFGQVVVDSVERDVAKCQLNGLQIPNRFVRRLCWTGKVLLATSRQDVAFEESKTPAGGGVVERYIFRIQLDNVVDHPVDVILYVQHSRGDIGREAVGCLRRSQGAYGAEKGRDDEELFELHCGKMSLKAVSVMVAVNVMVGMKEMVLGLLPGFYRIHLSWKPIRSLGNVRRYEVVANGLF